MLKFGVLACLIAVAFGATNHFIGSLISPAGANNFPYPINKCSRISLTTTDSAKYVCSSDKQSVVGYFYTDAACQTPSATPNITYSKITSQGINSFECDGNDYYASVDVHIGACTAAVTATTYYAVDVCYYATSGNYSSATCDDDQATVTTYGKDDTTCTGATYQSPLVAPSTCGLFTTIGGTIKIYAQLTDCMNGNTTDAAYIPSIMGVIVLLVLNIVNLL